MDAADGLLLEGLGLQERHDGAGDDAGVEDEDVVGDVEVDAAALVLRAQEEDSVRGRCRSARSGGRRRTLCSLVEILINNNNTTINSDQFSTMDSKHLQLDLNTL